MIKVLLIIFIAILGVFCFFSIKYANPYKFTFIFGLKGSGKSCFMIHEAFKYLKKGWNVYTDMDVFIPGVRLIKDADSLFKQYTPDKNSVILLDEIGGTWHAREWKKFDQKINEWFRYERKYECRVYANSQSWDIDKVLREKTDAMILQSNIGNVISISRPIIRSFTLTNPEYSGEGGKIVDSLHFASLFKCKFYLMPHYFKYFNSFEAPYRPPMPYKLYPCDYSYNSLRKFGFSKRVALRISSEYEKYYSSIEAPETIKSVQKSDNIATSAPIYLNNNT